MCNKDDFIKKEDEFISQLLASDIYKEYLESKERMERDKILLSLYEKRIESPFSISFSINMR